MYDQKITCICKLGWILFIWSEADHFVNSGYLLSDQTKEVVEVKSSDICSLNILLYPECLYVITKLLINSQQVAVVLFAFTIFSTEFFIIGKNKKIKQNKTLLASPLDCIINFLLLVSAVYYYRNEPVLFYTLVELIAFNYQVGVL